MMNLQYCQKFETIFCLQFSDTCVSTSTISLPEVKTDRHGNSRGLFYSRVVVHLDFGPANGCSARHLLINQLFLLLNKFFCISSSQM